MGDLCNVRFVAACCWVASAMRVLLNDDDNPSENAKLRKNALEEFGVYSATTNIPDVVVYHNILDRSESMKFI